MSKTAATYEGFVDKMLSGELLSSDIEDAIDTWHDSTSTLSLREYLGMHPAEYEAFLHDNSILEIIAIARKTRRNFDDTLSAHVNDNRADVVRMAARARDPGASDALLEWLRQRHDRPKG